MTRLVASPDRRRLALVEDARILVIDVPSGRASLEIGVTGAAEVVFVRDRLLVLTRDRSMLYVIDPRGGNKLAEAALRGPARLISITDDLALIATPCATWTLDHESIKPALLPVRGAVTAAGPTAGDTFVIAVGGVIEEWNAITRSPVRRMRRDRLGRARSWPMFVGGTEQRIWYVSRDATDELEVIALGSPTARQIDLPRHVQSLSAHGDLLAIAGADGTPFVVDLGSADPVRALPLPAVRELVWLAAGVLAYVTTDGALGFHGQVAGQVAPPVPHEAPRLDGPEDSLYSRLQAWRDRAAAPVRSATT